MIKTTSFAPSRPRGARSNAASSPSRSSVRAERASGRGAAPAVPVAPTPTAPVAEMPAREARAILAAAQTKAATMPRKTSPKAAPVAQPNLFSDAELAATAPAATLSAPAPAVPAKPVVAPKPAPAVPTKSVAAPKPVSAVPAKPVVATKPAPSVPASPVASPKPVSAVSASPVAAPASVVPPAPVVATKPKAPRLKRAKVPDNLAEQYGVNASKRADTPEIAVLPPESPRKRLTKTERAARRELMRPDEVLARLQRAASLPLRPVASEKREKGWKFECGRCGATSYFQTSGAICKCGALAIKE